MWIFSTFLTACFSFGLPLFWWLPSTAPKSFMIVRRIDWSGRRAIPVRTVCTQDYWKKYDSEKYDRGLRREEIWKLNSELDGQKSVFGKHGKKAERVCDGRVGKQRLQLSSGGYSCSDGQNPDCSRTVVIEL